MSQRPRQASQAQHKLAEVRRQQRARQRLLRILTGIAAVVAVALVVLVVILVVNHRSTTTAHNVSNSASGATVDNIKCETSEQAAYHIHAHLAIFVNGTAVPLQPGIGIPGGKPVQGFASGGKCLYWLHTHDASGVIHIESPVQRTYTLGQFFDIWGRPVSSSQVGPASGKVTVYVDGKQYTGDPRSITLTPHKVIQLDVGKVVAPKPYTFAHGL